MHTLRWIGPLELLIHMSTTPILILWRQWCSLGSWSYWLSFSRREHAIIVIGKAFATLLTTEWSVLTVYKECWDSTTLSYHILDEEWNLQSLWWGYLHPTENHLFVTLWHVFVASWFTLKSSWKLFVFSIFLS